MTLPWLDRGGRLSPLKLVVFVALFAPGAWTMGEYLLGVYGARPITGLTHATGDWTLRLLLLALAVTPIRQSLHWPQLIAVRRMTGVAAFAYVVVHFALYVVDQKFDVLRVASEIALRIYLTIGFATLLGLAALAATSTDAMLRRLGGRRWRRLHRLVYPLAALGTVHFFMQSKFDVAQPLWMAGLLVWLLLWRVVAAFRAPDVATLVALALVAGAATAAGEAAYIWFKIGVDPMRVLAMNWSRDGGLRPAWIVAATGLAFAALAALRASAKRRPERRLQSA